MAKQIIPNYTYSKAGKTITLSDFSTIRLDRIQLIVDVTINAIMYNFADPTVTATVATNVITLSAVPGASADTDKIEIYYDALLADPSYDAVRTKELRPATSTPSSVSVTTASTSILASNANRLGATIYNEGTATALVKLGATASASSYTTPIPSGGYYEVPFGYTGAIDGITAASTAQLRVTELTA